MERELGVEVIFNPKLREINFGVFRGGPKEKLNKFYSDNKRRFDKGPPEGESRDDVKERMIGVLKEIDQQYENKNILIISHGDPLWLLEGITKGLSDEEMLANRDDYIKTGQFRKLIINWKII